ncbi:MAG: UvrD-helicase domain-containing protein, partial [Chloroflexota bacterium]
MAESKGGKYVQMGFDFNFGGDGDGSQSHSSPSYSPSLGFVPNLYHHPIFAFGQTPNGGDGLIDACPGSGKTTTLLEFVRRLPKELEQSVLIVAFSKQIADELQPRLRQTGLAQRSSSVNGKCLVSSSTIHSLGLATLRHYLLRGGGGNSGVAGVVGARSSYGGKGNKGNNGNVTRPLPLLDESKYEKLAQIYLGKRQLNAKDYLYPVTELIRLAQLTLTDPNDEAAMKALTLRYDLIEALRFWETVLVATRDLLERGKEVALEEHRINFEDMLWLPYVLDLTPPEQFQWVFVDEYQDLSRAQFELVMRCRAAAAEGEGGGGG